MYDFTYITINITCAIDILSKETYIASKWIWIACNYSIILRSNSHNIKTRFFDLAITKSN